MQNISDLLDLIAAPSVSLIGRTFARMEIAEDEIARAKERHPTAAARLDRAFGILCPTAPINDKSTDVYRAHVAELLDRVARDEDTTLATRAEVLCLLLDTSLKAPLRPEAQACAERLFAGVTGEPAPGPGATAEPWPQAAAEVLADCARKLRSPDRTVEA